MKYAAQVDAVRTRYRERVLRLLTHRPELSYRQVALRTDLSMNTVFRIAAASGIRRTRGAKKTINEQG